MTAAGEPAPRQGGSGDGHDHGHEHDRGRDRDRDGHEHDRPHGHADGHGHGHSHAHGSGANERATAIAALLVAGFMGVEFAGGVLANSLALISDAAHMATDALALALAWWGFRQARRPATPDLSYGRHRLPVLIAFANGIVLLLLTVWIVVEAAGRIATPEPVASVTLIVVAFLGLLVNVAAFLVLSGGARENLNIRAALLHVASDLLGSVAALAAGFVILFTGWTPIDPILSVLVAVLILRATWRLLRESAHVLLEGAPPGRTGREIAADLADGVPGLAGVHHVHAWSLSEERTVATLHAVVAPDADPAVVAAAVRGRLADRFGIGHVTVEIERAGAACPPAEGCA